MSDDSKIDDGGPAFPVAEDHNIAADLQWTSGLSIRDWFAGQALAGVIAGNKWGECGVLEIAEDAYLYADAMLKVRKVKR